MEKQELNEIYNLAKEIDYLRNELSVLKEKKQKHTHKKKTDFPTSDVPISYAQQRFWWAHKKSPDTIVHNMSLGVLIKGKLNLKKLAKSLEILIAREQMLRVEVYEKDGIPKQRIIPSSQFSTPLYNIDIGRNDDKSRLELAISEHLCKPFDLSKAPLWKLLVIKVKTHVYQLVLIMHHIIADAASFAIFYRNLSQVYLSLDQHLQNDEILEQNSFLEYVVAEQGKGIENKETEASKYWTNVMQGELPILNLPYDFPSSSQTNYKGGTVTSFLNSNKLIRLKKVATKSHATSYMVFLAVFYSLLHKITNQNDFTVIGMAAGREEEKYRNSFGCFANALPLRFRSEDFSSFANILSKVRDIVVYSMKYQSYPLQKIQISSASSQVVNHSIFSTHFNLQSSIGNLNELFGFNNCKVTDHWHLRKSSEFDIFLHLKESSEGLHLSFEYSSDKFKEDTIKRFAIAYEYLIDESLNGSDFDIDKVNIISEADKQLLLDTWNGKIKDYPKDICYQTLFENQASSTPEKEALIWNTESISYYILNEKANKLAHYLRKLGVTPNTLVGLSVPRTPEMIIALLAILKAGGAYVPLDHTYPKERLTYIVKEAKITMIISLTSTAHSLPRLDNVRIITLDTLQEKLKKESGNNPDIINDSSDVVYAIFTSGSTGNPKGVPIKHYSLVNLMYWGNEYFSAAELSGFFAGSSVGFDASVFELLTPLAWGGKIILAENILYFSELSCLKDVTVLTGTPSGIMSILRSGIQLPKSLISVVLLGEGVPKDLVDKLYEFPNIKHVINAYGLTETTVHSLVATIDRVASFIPIGTPLPNTQVYILDEKQNLMPIGVAGEIYIGGIGLSDGFLRRPELTAKRFFKNPFSNDRDAKIYKTGDLGRYASDGQIEYLGRSDFQVKIRGFRLELEEIEAKLRGHEGISDCVVSAQNNDRQEKELVAYFTSTATGLSEKNLRTYLMQKLPNFMIPEKFILVDEIPISPNGKTDRKKLLNKEKLTKKIPKPSSNVHNLPIRKIVQKVWREVLGSKEILRDGNFFNLGGHSLLVPQLQASFKRILKVNIPIADFFSYPDLENFVENLKTNYLHLFDSETKIISQDFQEGNSSEIKKEEFVNRSAVSSNDANTNEVDERDIAIIGIGCRLPEANTPEEFWQKVCQAKSLSKEVPKERWNWYEYSLSSPVSSHKSKGKWGVFLSDIDKFDPNFFQISKPEAKWLDPQQRLLLMSAYEAFTYAGYNPFNLSQQNQKTAVFVGASFTDYARLIERSKVNSNPYIGLGNSLSFLSNRLSYTFGLLGPSLTLDTACSSSVLALYSAIECLRNNTSYMAIAGGVGLMLIPDNLSFWTQMGILGQDRQSKAFDASASGFIPGEAVVCVLLKKYSNAIKDHDNICAIIKGASANQDGKRKFSITATSPNAQKELILSTCADAKLTCENISFVETHGTGTSLGDPVEIRGLTDAFQTHTHRKGICAIGAVKSIYGHSGPAAGLVGLLKCVMALKHKTLPPMPLLRPNIEIFFENSPFYVNDKLRHWEANSKPRRAALSGLGFGGTNAHFILEEYIKRESGVSKGKALCFLLISAHSSAALKEVVKTYINYLSKQDRNISINNLCYTLLRGNGNFPYRLVVIGDNVEEICSKLKKFLDDSRLENIEINSNVLWNCIQQSNIPNSTEQNFLDEIKSRLNDEAVKVAKIIDVSNALNLSLNIQLDRLEPSQKLTQEVWWKDIANLVAYLYVYGKLIETSYLEKCFQGNRISLPIYPYNNQSYWFNNSFSSKELVVTNSAPLPLHENANFEVYLNKWFHKIKWQEKPLLLTKQKSDSLYVVFDDSLSICSSAVEQITKEAITKNIIQILPSNVFETLTKKSHLRIRPKEREDYEKLFNILSVDKFSDVTFVYGWAMDNSINTLENLFLLLKILGKKLVNLPQETKIHFKMITNNCQSINISNSKLPFAAACWGLIRVAQQELHSIKFKCIDLDTEGIITSVIVKYVLEELLADNMDKEVVYSNKRRYTPTYRHFEKDDYLDEKPPFKKDGVYLISGGLGGIGQALGEWLIENYNANVILFSRSSQNFANKLSKSLWIMQADVTDERNMTELIAKCRNKFDEINGVFHLAGITENNLITQKSLEELQRVVKAKIEGAIVLDRVLKNEHLDFMVFFSSIAAINGNIFQSDYSAANSFLDAFAGWRSNHGQRTVSINWGTWAEIGMAHRQGLTKISSSKSGLGGEFVTPSMGMDLLTLSLCTQLSQVIAANLDYSNSLQDIKVEKEYDSCTQPITNNKKEQVEKWLLQLLSTTLETDQDDINPTQSFLELGLDSILSVRLVDKINKKLNQQFPRTLFFLYPNIQELSIYISIKTTGKEAVFFDNNKTLLKASNIDKKLVFDQQNSITVNKPSGAIPDKNISEIAIIGLSCRASRSPDSSAFWNKLCDSFDSIESLTATSQGIDAGYSKYYGSFISDTEKFDAKFFRLSQREAEEMDSQQRIILELTWEALEKAGYSSRDLSGQKVGVYTGTMSNLFLAKPEVLTPHSLLCNSTSTIPSRISYFFNFTGPCLSIETLCSSSLVALHYAVCNLRQNKCNYAIVGGIRIGIPSTHYEGSALMKALSPRGRCRSFAKKGDGFVPGEGGAVVVLKRLEDAKRDKDNILAVIKGSATNHGGQGSGLTVPSAKGQSELILSALSDAKIEADTISYIEAHGTGTELGDPIEVEGLNRAFSEHTERKQYCAIGSVKTNIGHTEPAAGLMGLAKVVLALQAKRLPPIVGLEEPNPHINFVDSPFYINDRLSDWHTEKGMPRRAGVSAFGIGGTNAHVILEEAPPRIDEKPKYSRSHEIFVLSARDKTALKSYAESMIKHFEKRKEDSLTDICYSSNRGKSVFEQRIAIIVKDKNEILEKLVQYIQEGSGLGLHIGQGKMSEKPKIAFLFTGQGSQYVGMGKRLYEEEPIFRKTLDQCAELLESYIDRPLLEIMFNEKNLIHETKYTQPALFALEYSLAFMLESWGIVAEGLLGHSLGEYVAACIAGSISLEDALTLVSARGCLMQELPSSGGMGVVFASQDEVRKLLKDHENKLVISGINAPNNITVSGEKESLETLCKVLTRRGIDFHLLQVSHAFHSPLIKASLSDLKQTAEKLSIQSPTRTLVSNLWGRAFREGEKPDSDYWIKQTSSAVLFEDGVRNLKARGCTVFVEIGPRSVLTRLTETTLQDSKCTYLSPLSAQENHLQDMVAKLFVIGTPIDWRAYFVEFAPRYFPGPTYPFQRQSYPISVNDLFRNNRVITQQNKNENKKDSLTKPTIFEYIATALKVPITKLDTDAEFLEMGADSLSLSDILAKISRQFGVDIKMQQLFDEIETPQKLWLYIQSQTKGNNLQNNIPETTNVKVTDINNNLHQAKETEPAIDIKSLPSQILKYLEGALKISISEAEMDNQFLEMGADSLSLSNILVQISRQFDVNIKMQQLFDEIDTPNKLCIYIQQQIKLKNHEPNLLKSVH